MILCFSDLEQQLAKGMGTRELDDQDYVNDLFQTLILNYCSHFNARSPLSDEKFVFYFTIFEIVSIFKFDM